MFYIRLKPIGFYTLTFAIPFDMSDYEKNGQEDLEKVGISFYKILTPIKIYSTIIL